MSVPIGWRSAPAAGESLSLRAGAASLAAGPRIGVEAPRRRDQCRTGDDELPRCELVEQIALARQRGGIVGAYRRQQVAGFGPVRADQIPWPPHEMAIVQPALAENIDIWPPQRPLSLGIGRRELLKEKRRQPTPQAPVVRNQMRVIGAQQVDQKQRQIHSGP